MPKTRRKKRAAKKVRAVKPKGAGGTAVTLRDVSTLRPYKRNPRLADKAVDAVAASIDEFGFRQPIVIDKKGLIIVGHTRYRAALKLGLTQVPVHVVENLTPAQIKAYRIADNQTNTLTSWDPELLPLELKDLQDADVDLSVLGFDDKVLAELLAAVLPVKPGGPADPDWVPPPPDKVVTRRGDLWRLGRHRLFCGDMRSTWPKCFPKEGFILFADPPFELSLDQLLSEGRLARPGAAVTVLLQSLSVCIKRKEPWPGRVLTSFAVEEQLPNICLTRQLPCPRTYVAVVLGLAKGAAWRRPYPQTFMCDFLHEPVGHRELPKTIGPYSKPTKTMQTILRGCRGHCGALVDPWAGAGTSAIVAELQGWTAYMIEIDRRMCDVIVQRYERYTGRRALRAARDRGKRSGVA